MSLSKEDKDEIRELIAREIRDVIKNADNAGANKALLDAAEANYREAQARVVEKTDPARAERIRRIVPEF